MFDMPKNDPVVTSQQLISLKDATARSVDFKEK